MIKGGYKIVNFNGAALSGTAVELSGIYDQIVDNYDKPIMVSGVTISGKLQDDVYADVQEKTAQDLSKSVELTVYGGIITVTEDDEVTFVVSKTTAELTAEIGDLDDLDTTEKGSVVDAINEVVENIGEIGDLETEVKTSIVDAINGNIIKCSYGSIYTTDVAANSDFTVTPTMPSDLNKLLAVIPIGTDAASNWNSYCIFKGLTGENNSSIVAHVLGTGTQRFNVRYYILYI